jgi:hypothetical protein
MRPLGPRPAVEDTIAAIAKALEKAAFPVFGDGGARHRDAGVAAGEPRRHLAGQWQNCNPGCDFIDQRRARQRDGEIRKLAGPANGAG